MHDLFVAVGLLLVLEGIIYAAVPHAMRRVLVTVLDQPDSVIRRAGLVAAVTGVFVVWLVRG